MRLNDMIEGLVEEAREHKQYVCRNRPCDLEPMARFFRGDDLVATVGIPGGSELQMPVVALAAAGFDADVLTLVSDTYTDVQPIGIRNTNPLTGRPWIPGEICDYAENHGGLESGVIAESLLLYVVNRAGDKRSRLLPYRYEGNNVIWVDWHTDPMFGIPEDLRDVNEDELLNIGFIPESLVEAMQAPSVAQSHFKIFGLAIEDRGPDWDQNSRDAYAAHGLAELFPGVKVALHTASDDAARMARLSQIGTVVRSEGE